MKQEIFSLIQQMWSERWDVLLIVMILAYRKSLFNAFAGGNGHLQVDEVGKGIILFVFYASFRAESSRTDLTHPIFSDTYWFALLGSVGILSGIKEWKMIIQSKLGSKEKPA